MHHFDIDVGFLVNFPHDSGFPDVSEEGHGSVFRVRVLSGMDAQLSDRVTRGKHASDTVQVVMVTRVVSAPPRPAEPGAPPALASPPRVYGVTKAGEPCKVCRTEGRFCQMHVGQRQ
jgi:hypothetical protein